MNLEKRFLDSVKSVKLEVLEDIYSRTDLGIELFNKLLEEDNSSESVRKTYSDWVLTEYLFISELDFIDLIEFLESEN